MAKILDLRCLELYLFKADMIMKTANLFIAVVIGLGTASHKAHSDDHFLKTEILLAANGLTLQNHQEEGLKGKLSFSITGSSFSDTSPSYKNLHGTHALAVHKKLRFIGGNRYCNQFDSRETMDCRASILQFSSIAEVPFEQGISVYGRLGFQYLQKDNAGEIDLLRLNLNDLGAVFGFGLKYEIKKDWYLSAEAEGFGDQHLDFMGVGSSMRLVEPKHSIGLSVRF